MSVGIGIAPRLNGIVEDRADKGLSLRQGAISKKEIVAKRGPRDE